MIFSLFFRKNLSGGQCANRAGHHGNSKAAQIPPTNHRDQGIRVPLGSCKFNLPTGLSLGMFTFHRKGWLGLADLGFAPH